MSTTLDQLLTLLDQADDELDLVSSEQIITDLKDKVDKIKYVLDKLAAYEEFLDEQIEPLKKAKRATNANITNLKRAVAISMENHALEQLPGTTWRLNLQDNPPQVSYIQEAPSALDYQMYPQMVELRRSYHWKTDVVKERLRQGDQLPFASMTRGKHARFYLNKPLLRVKSDPKLLLEGPLDSAREPAKSPDNAAKLCVLEPLENEKQDDAD